MERVEVAEKTEYGFDSSKHNDDDTSEDDAAAGACIEN